MPSCACHTRWFGTGTTKMVTTLTVTAVDGIMCDARGAKHGSSIWTATHILDTNSCNQMVPNVAACTVRRFMLRAVGSRGSNSVLTGAALGGARGLLYDTSYTARCFACEHRVRVANWRAHVTTKHGVGAISSTGTTRRWKQRKPLAHCPARS